MPLIYYYRCDRCNLALPTGWGGNMYVTDRNGERIACHHPCETLITENVLRESFPELAEELKSRWSILAFARRMGARIRATLTGRPQPFDIDAFVASRRGFNTDCLCRACLKQFPLDLERDRRECPSCKSGDVSSVRELIDQLCPQCREGRIREIATGLKS